MTDLSIINQVPVPGDDLCFSIKEFGEAMGAAQGATIASAGQAMLIFFIVGLIIGGVFTYVLIRSKDKIEELTPQEPD